MHDIRDIRSDPEGFDRALARRAALGRMQELQARRNQLAREIGEAKRAGRETAALETEAARLREEIAALEAKAREEEEALAQALALLPNRLDEDVPEGRDENDNVVVKTWGGPRVFPFPARQHFELGEALRLMDFERAAKLAGSRFVVLRGALARLARALAQFMLDLQSGEFGYEEHQVPLLVSRETMFGTGQLPKFEEELFQTRDGRFLIPTAEVPLTNLVAGEILPDSRLPLRFTALTPCFRAEAGAAGRDTRGMLRQHQFDKVELVSITLPEQSGEEHERMTRAAETVLERLGLPYRRVLLCAGDTGFAAAKTYDLEVWLPGQGRYREISSCSNCRDFQARRMNARFRRADGKVGGFVHTLNGSGVAVGRALIAVMENYQEADGGIRIPEALRPYMGGLERISPAS